MGNGLHGTFPILIQPQVHPFGSRLYIKMGGSNANDSRVVENFLRSHIFTRFGTPWALITDGETYLCNRVIDNVLRKYSVRNHTSLSYHLQTNEQDKVSNREIKSILEKTVNSSKNDWARKIDDSL